MAASRARTSLPWAAAVSLARTVANQRPSVIWETRRVGITKLKHTHPPSHTHTQDGAVPAEVRAALAKLAAALDELAGQGDTKGEGQASD